MKFEKIRIPTAEGQELAAQLDIPIDGEARTYALFVHCFTCSKNLKAVSTISTALTQAGIGVLRFDFTGLGENKDEFAETNFAATVADLVTAAHYLAAHYGPAQLLVGHSLGGAAVLQAAAQLTEAKAIATIGAPAGATQVEGLLACGLDEIEARGEADVRLAERQFTVKKQFLDDLAAQNMGEAIRKLKRPLLVFHSPIDNTVGVENAAEIFRAAKHPKSFVSLDKADHFLTREADARYAGAVLAAWAQTYLDVAQPAAVPIEQDGRVFVRTEGGYRTAVRVGQHGLVADEPIPLGGTDMGPNPYEYLLASLGSCTSITLRMYADRKGWPLKAINVRLSHAKIHAQECDECTTTTGKVDRIEREIELVGPLDGAQRQRLLEIADKCPVHRTLHSETVVVTHLRGER